MNVPSVTIYLNCQQQQNGWFVFQSAKKNCMLTDGRNTDNNGKLVMWGECFTNIKNAWWKAVNVRSLFRNNIERQNDLN